MRPRYAVAALVALTCVLAPAEPVRAQRTAAPAPDPLAISTAEQMRRSGSSAEAVGREVRSSFRQSGPQMVAILVGVGFPEPEVGRAVATETRGDAATASRWLAEGAVPAGAAYSIVHDMVRAAPTAVDALVAAGYPLHDAVAARQRVHPVDSRTQAAELRATPATPEEVGSVFNSLMGASAANAARDLLHAGYAVPEVVSALLDGYGLSAAQVAHVLRDEGVDPPEILDALLEPSSGVSTADAVAAFEGIGGEAGDAGLLLRDRGENPSEAATPLLLAGYDPVLVGDVLHGVWGLAPGSVAVVLSGAGVALAPVTTWLAASGAAPAEGVAILRAVGAGAPVAAEAMIGSGWIGSGQGMPWTGWALTAAYECGPVAVALRDAFGVPVEVAAAALAVAGCAEEALVQALGAAFGATLGVGAETQVAVARAMIEAGSAPLLALSVSASLVEATLERTLELAITQLSDLVGLGDAFAWLRNQGASAGEAALWAAGAGAGATEVAVSLQAGFQANALGAGTALAEAGFEPLEIVTGLKEGLGVTYDEMVGIAGSMPIDMTLMMEAIQKAWG